MTAIFEETRDVNRRLNSDILSGRRAARSGLPSARGAAITESEWTRRYLARQWATSSLPFTQRHQRPRHAHPIATQAGRHSALRQYGSGVKCRLLYPDHGCASRGISGCWAGRIQSLRTGMGTKPSVQLSSSTVQMSMMKQSGSSATPGGIWAREMAATAACSELAAHDLHVVEVTVNQHLTGGVAVLHRGPVEVLRVPYLPEQMDVHPRRVGPHEKRQMSDGSRVTPHPHLTRHHLTAHPDRDTPADPRPRRSARVCHHLAARAQNPRSGFSRRSSATRTTSRWRPSSSSDPRSFRRSTAEPAMSSLPHRRVVLADPAGPPPQLGAGDR